MNALQQQEQRGTATRPKNFVSPEVDIHEGKDAYLLEAEMPGVGKDGIEITLEGNELTLTGHRSDETIGGEVVIERAGLSIIAAPSNSIPRSTPEGLRRRSSRECSGWCCRSTRK